MLHRKHLRLLNEGEIRADERLIAKRRADLAWEQDTTFFERAWNGFCRFPMTGPVLYQEEVRNILEELKGRERDTRVWLTEKQDALAKKFPMV
jgi:hypothetical protein